MTGLATAPRESTPLTGTASIGSKRPLAVAPDERGSRNLVYAAWFLVLFDPHRLLAAVIAPQFGSLASLTYALLLGMILLRAPSNITAGRVWVLYPLYLMWLFSGLLAFPVVPNMRIMYDGLKLLTLFWAIGAATPDVIRVPKHVLPILAMFGLRFLWWQAMAGTNGDIAWHPSLANEDGYGSLMSIGAGVCYFLAMGWQRRWMKYLLFAIAAIAVLGVVASFARGAFLALVLVGAIIWLRSPNKVWTTVAIVGAGAVALLGAKFLFEGSAFYAEIMSSFSEGNESGTGLHRWELWTTAMRVFKEHWIFGVGAGNVTIYASGIVQPYELTLFPIPEMLWGFNLHNAYLQVLSEFGVVGMACFLGLHVDFFLKNRALRTKNANAVWTAGGADRTVSLHHASLALEAGFVALMMTNLIYANLFESWLMVFWALNRTLWGATRRSNLRRASESAGRGQPGALREAGALRRQPARAS